MGPQGTSGFYLGRKAAALLALLLAALLLVLAVLGALYGLCRLKEAGPVPPSATAPCPEEKAEPPSSSPTSARPPGLWDQFRLPRTLLPLDYQLQLWPQLWPGQPRGPSLFFGQVNLTVRCLQATATVLLHSAKLRYWRAAVWGPLPAGPGSAIPVAELWLAERTEYLVLELGQSLNPGSRYVLQLSYQGVVEEANFYGLFFVPYKDMGQSRLLVASQMEPTFARTVYPCFDEPAMKATFNVKIVHHPKYVALSNMPAIDVSEFKDANTSKLSNWSITTFNTTLKMSTYITAFVISEFDYITSSVRGNEIRIWARKEAIQNGFFDYALNITGQLFSFLEDLFNISYPLSKTDLVALPGFIGIGAMENWGLMIFQESTLMYSPSDKFSGKKAEICQIVSHELAHQWFGNLVTMNWWNDIWLNEGFASYFEYIGASYIEPTLTLVNLFFFLFQSYLKTFPFSNTNQDNLWTHIQMVIDEQNEVHLPVSVKTIMDSWTCQTNFPLLTVNPSTGNISQKQFYAKDRENDSTVYNNTWIITVSWLRNGSAQPLVWLDKSSKIFPEMQVSDSGHDWIILNVNTTGYYRVNYEQSYWKRLAQLLESNPKAIPVVNKLQLIDDAFALEQAGYIEIDIALDLTKYLEKEDEILIWFTVLSYILPEGLEKKILMTTCWLGHRDCIDLSYELFAKWMDNPKNEIPSSIKGFICCHGIAMGSDKEWDVIWKILKANDTTKEEKYLVDSLQIFYNNTLEENQRIIVTEALHIAKFENEERRKSLNKIIEWLQKNIDD
uniref:Aminopeptidase n=1 Tax=Sphenodon punctatus TaxID=8508 RepID=A0A8D0HCZ6_SPHPU